LERAQQHAPSSFEKWFSGIQLDGFDSGALFLCARDEFVRDWVRTHYLPTIIGELAQRLGKSSDSLQVHWRISSQLERPACQPPRPSEPPRRPAGELGSM